MKHRTDAALTSRGTRRHVAVKRPTVEPTKQGPDQGAATLRGLRDKIVSVAIDDLKPFPGNPRRHPEAQIARLMRSIEQVWTNPILIDETGTNAEEPGIAPGSSGQPCSDATYSPFRFEQGLAAAT